MKHRFKFNAAAAAWVVGLALAGSVDSLNAQRAIEPITLNFNNAEIESVARAMAAMFGRNVVVDPRVKGTITLNTERPVPPTVAMNQFLAALRLQGFAMVESAGLYKVVPEADAKLQGSAASISSGTEATGVVGNQVITKVFRLNHETAINLVPVLRPLISPNNTINVNPGNNSLVITDYADNVARLERIITALDLASATDLEIITLKHAIASDLGPLVLRLLESGAAPIGAAAQGQADSGFRTTVIAEPRSNALIIRAANAARLALARSLVTRLDTPSSASATGNVHVVYLKNADAVEIAPFLRAAMGGSGATSGASTASPTPSGAGAATAPLSNTQASIGGQIQADPATNSLIITAPEPQYRQLRAVIDQLDGPRVQVLVESVIAEVSADKAAEFGIQWQGVLGGKGDTNIGLLGTNFGTLGANIINLATQAALPAAGANFGIAHRTNGVYVLGFLARFLETKGDGNILSTPHITTLNNREAKIVIGQNVPFVTGQYTNNNSGGSGSVNPFQTIERKDVGLTLRVKPQVSEGGTIKLQTFLEVSSVQGSSVNSPSGLITNKRSIESNVVVDDGAIIVLGGLLQDEYAGNQEKVPGVGDIPFFGNLFRTEKRDRKKTNLMVFLRPSVVRDGASADALTMERYEAMRRLQQANQPTPSQVLPVNEAPVLPAMPAARPPASAPVSVPAPAQPPR